MTGQVPTRSLQEQGPVAAPGGGDQERRTGSRTKPARASQTVREVGFYRSDAEFGALIVPFVEEGVAGEARYEILGYDDRKATCSVVAVTATP